MTVTEFISKVQGAHLNDQGFNFRLSDEGYEVEAIYNGDHVEYITADGSESISIREFIGQIILLADSPDSYLDATFEIQA